MPRVPTIPVVATLCVACIPAFAADPAPTAVDVELAARADVRGTLRGPDEVDVFRWRAPVGATITFRVAASPARAIDFDVRLVDPAGAEVPLAGLPRFTDRGGLVALSKYAPPTAGVYVLRVGGKGSGAYRLTWTASPGAKAVQRCDLRCTTLGRALGDETAIGRAVAAGAATTLDVAAADSDLRFARLDVLADAAPAGTSLLLTSSVGAAVPDPSTLQSAGPDVLVQPSSLVLSSPATLTLPYERILVPRTASAATDLRVARVAKNGTISVLAPTSVDTAGRTVSVTTDRLGRFVVFAPKGPPDPTSEAYWHVALDVTLEQAATGADSRARRAQVESGLASFSGGGALAFVGDRFETSWTHDDQGAGHVTRTSFHDEPASLAWSFDADGRRIRIDDGSGRASVLEPSEDGAAYVGQIGETTWNSRAGVEAALRRSPRALSAESIAGSYWIGALEVQALQGAASAMDVETWRTSAAATLRADGTWTIAGDSRLATFDPSDRRTKLGRGRIAGGGTWTIVGAEGGWREGSIALTISGADSVAPLLIFPSADRRMFLGTTDPTSEGDHMFLVGVRRSTSMSPRLLTGDYAMGGFEARVSTYSPATGPVVGDLGVSQTEAVARYASGARRFGVSSEARRDVDRDPGAALGVRVAYAIDHPTDAVAFSLARSGRLSVRADPRFEIVGAMTPDARAGFVVSRPVRGIDFFGVRLLVKSPPSP